MAPWKHFRTSHLTKLTRHIPQQQTQIHMYTQSYIILHPYIYIYIEQSWIHIYIYTYTNIQRYLYVYLYIYIYIYVCVVIYICIVIYIYVQLYIYRDRYICVYIYIYTDIGINRLVQTYIQYVCIMQIDMGVWIGIYRRTCTQRFGLSSAHICLWFNSCSGPRHRKCLWLFLLSQCCDCFVRMSILSALL